MSRMRLLLLAMSLLVGMTPLIVPPGASAQNPNRPIVLTVDDTFEAPNLTRECGFSVEAHLSGTFTFKVLRNGLELDRLRLTYTFTGPGGTTSLDRVENIRYAATFSPDGTLVEDVTATGTLLHHNVLPGEGSLGNNSGREVFQITWQYDEDLDEYVEVDFQILFDAGQNDEVDDAEFALICERLA
jgi:hypothetical protein